MADPEAARRAFAQELDALVGRSPASTARITATARRHGIGYSTLRSWCTGIHLPRVPEDNPEFRAFLLAIAADPEHAKRVVALAQRAWRCAARAKRHRSTGDPSSTVNLDVGSTYEGVGQDARRAVETWQVEQICKTAKMFSDWQHLHGGWALREGMRAELRQAAQLLGQPCRDNLRPRLCRAVARFAHAAAFSAFDIGENDEACRYFRFGLACVEEIGDLHLRAFFLTSMARQAVWLGHPDDSLAFAEQGLVRADRLTATERAMLCAARARALAAMHRDADAIRAVGEADKQFAHSEPGDDPPWARFYDHPQHCGDTGAALLELAFRGHCVDQARTRMSASATGHLDAHLRSRVLAQLQLAALDMAIGNPYEAVTTGTEALDTALTIRSDRVLETMRRLDRYAARHEHIPAVSAYRLRLATELADRTM